MQGFKLSAQKSAYRKILGLLILMTLPKLAVAYPVLVEAERFSKLFGQQRASLIAIAANKEIKTRIPLQIDEVEDGAALVLRNPYVVRDLRSSLAHPKKSDPFFGRLQSVHRMVLDDRDFKTCDQDCQTAVPAGLRPLRHHPQTSDLRHTPLQTRPPCTLCPSTSQSISPPSQVLIPPRRP